jgi:phage baseplate assembly protein W
MEYLRLPYQAKKGYLNRGDRHQSIIDSVGLILSTRMGRIGFLPDYGSEIWEREYGDIFSANKADIRSALRNAIDRYEKRLYNLSISFSPSDQEAAARLGMVVKVTGNFRDDDDEERKFETVYRLA